MAETSVTRIDHILVIDDDVILCELLSLLLGAEGHTVLTAASGDEALALLSTMPSGELPTVFLADLKMPGMPPAALAIQLRIVSPLAILLAMSASEPVADQIAGFDGFLRKPFTVAELNAVISSAHKLTAEPEMSGLQRSSPATHDTLDKRDSAVPPLDEVIHSKLFSVMGGAQLPKLYTLLLDDANSRVERMRAAVAGNDAGTFAREAHAIKGGCGMLGATELYSLASRMETGGFACSSLLSDFRPAFERLRRILEKRMHQ